MVTEYDRIGRAYARSNHKWDKVHVIAPTMEAMLHLEKDYTALDLGCGDGFFAERIAKRGLHVVGWDESRSQLKRARSNRSGVLYEKKNVFSDDMPMVDNICAPFVTNLAKDTKALQRFFTRCHDALFPGGVLALTLDMPVRRSPEYVQYAKWFGATKYFLEPPAEGAKLRCDLFCYEEPITSLYPRYYSWELVSNLLHDVGLDPRIVPPTVSKQACVTKELSQIYLDHCNELLYVSAQK